MAKKSLRILKYCFCPDPKSTRNSRRDTRGSDHNSPPKEDKDGEGGDEKEGDEEKKESEEEEEESEEEESEERMRPWT